MKEEPEVFAGYWITTEEFCNLTPQNMFHRQLDRSSLPEVEPERQNRHILFRRKFTLTATDNVILHISADDYYKLYVNGVFVTQGPAAGYSFHYFYNRVDLSKFVHPGENTIAVHTYYQGLINRVWVSGDRQHGLLLDLFAQEKLLLASDESFLCRVHSGFSAAGKAGYETQFLERYDAASPEVGFEQPEFDDSGWNPAKIRRHAAYRMFRQPTAQLEFESIAPAAVEPLANGFRIDFGAIYVGSLTFRARGKRAAVFFSCFRNGPEIVLTTRQTTFCPSR